MEKLINTIKSKWIALLVEGTLGIVLVLIGFFGWEYFSDRWGSLGVLLGLVIILFGFASLSAFFVLLFMDEPERDPYEKSTTWDHWSTPNRTVRGFEIVERERDLEGGGGPGGY